MKAILMGICGDNVKYDYIGIAVRSIDETLDNAVKIVGKIQDVTVSFVSIHGINIRLIEPNSINSLVHNML